MELGNKIKKLRLSHGLTQEKLAEKLGVAFQTISKWENNVCAPDIEMLPKLSVIFGVSIDEIFDLTTEQRLRRIENMLDDERELPYATFQETITFLNEQVNSYKDKGRIYGFLAHMYYHRMVSDSEYVEEYVAKALEKRDNIHDTQWLLQKASGAAIKDFSDKCHYKVIDLYKSIINKGSDNETNYFCLLDNLIDDNRTKEAEEVLKEYEKISMFNPLRKLIYEVKIADKNHDDELANRIIKEIEDKYTDDALAMYELANIHAGNCEYNEAIDKFSKSFELAEKPRYIDALRGIEICYEIMGEYEQAAAYCDKQVEVYMKEWGIEEGEIIESIIRRKNSILAR